MIKKFITCPKCSKMGRFASTLCPHCGYDATKIAAVVIAPEVEKAAAELLHVEPVAWPTIPPGMFDE
jgi:hypothetical protein